MARQITNFPNAIFPAGKTEMLLPCTDCPELPLSRSLISRLSQVFNPVPYPRAQAASSEFSGPPGKPTDCTGRGGGCSNKDGGIAPLRDKGGEEWGGQTSEIRHLSDASIHFSQTGHCVSCATETGFTSRAGFRHVREHCDVTVSEAKIIFLQEG